ncbi:uncharacterized protein N7515_001172 [Penicillium bovifimosum]|uniref:Uncharacterized protein n=1 Tax=Penicillium bovifimosum TaxID=126998 RepID=A0A9W9HHA3_9EURO|nr:uncharacterized protein N7515_001172 [Penicillium bovifimosum]KAJ5146608.1 hypothetical protein N7515_001172 [Penicillium bovifimosum]
MNDIADIVRAIGHQQGEYAYYRACYSLFKQLQDLVAKVTEDLNGLCESQQCNPSEGFLAVSQVAEDFRSSVQSISAHEKNARLALANLCSSNKPQTNPDRAGNAE